MDKHRVLRGDVRSYNGRAAVVLSTQRGRAGEASTMVVIGLGTVGDPGVVHARETLALGTVEAMSLIGRGRISIRDAGGYYYAPKWGSPP